MLIAFFAPIFLFGQDVSLSKVLKSVESKDKILYRIPKENPNSEYLGEIEVRGFVGNPVDAFSKIYKKAKQIGANTFSLNIKENLDGTTSKFDEQHFFLSLYYTQAQNIPKQDGILYIIASEKKEQKIAINNKFLKLPTRTFCRISLVSGEIYSISTRKLLGSTIKISSTPNQPAQYYLISAFKISQNPYGTAGINLKSGDIMPIERSFAEFLTTIFKEIKTEN